MGGRDPVDELHVDLFIDFRKRPRLSKHTALEVANAVYRGHEPGDPPPLTPGDPVPGCDCPDCTGIAEDDPVRAFGRRARRQTERLPVEEAKRMNILQVASRLELGEPVPRGDEWAVRCPMHDDETPSLYMNDLEGVWYCFGCAEGGDTIRLLEWVRGCTFQQAVRELAGV